MPLALFVVALACLAWPAASHNASATTCVVEDKLTPVQCSVLMDEFKTACKAPFGGWSAVSAASYTCSEQCARTFVTAYNDCHLSYMARVEELNKAQQEALQVLVAKESGACRLTFTNMVTKGMQNAASVCKAQYAACDADQQCHSEVRQAWKDTLYPASQTLFESKLCGMSRQFTEFYECADQKVFSGSWKRTSCLLRDIWPPPSCTNTRQDIDDECVAPNGGWTVANVRNYDCSVACARKMREHWHYCQTTFAKQVHALAAAKKAAFYALIDDKPEGSCTKSFRAVVTDGLKKIARGKCGTFYDRCMTSGWCKDNVKELVEANLVDPDSKKYFETSMCQRSPGFQQLYQCVDADFDKESPWRRKACAIPDKLSGAQCTNVIASFRTGPLKRSVCPAPTGGWTPQAVASYDCALECAQMLSTAWWQCQTSFLEDFDGSSQVYQNTILALWDSDPESPGACAVTEGNFIRTGMAKVAMDPKCGPLYNKCYESLSCRKHIRDGIQSMTYSASRVLHESTVCSTPLEYQELHECSTALMASDLDIKPFRRITCIQRDELPPPFCRYLLGNLNTTCPSDDSNTFNAQNAESYQCSKDCARSLVTAWHYCQTRFYLTAKAMDADSRAALKVLVRPTPPGPCTVTFSRLVDEKAVKLAADPVCGPLYDQCTTSGWCMYNLRDATMSLADEHAREAFESTMCNSDKSHEFQRLYSCISEHQAGSKGWKRSQCAEPDVLTPSQCAVMLSGLDAKSTHPSCKAPPSGWSVNAIATYECSEECASTLTTVYLDCRTSFWRYVEDNAGDWSEQGLQTLLAMVDQDPEQPGPCTATRYRMVHQSMASLRASSSCGPKFRACMRKFDCRMELQDSIGRMLTQASRLTFETSLCSQTREMQDLYECAGAAGLVGNEQFYWKQTRCWKKNIAPPSKCTDVMAAVGKNCPAVKELTVDTAYTYSCPKECGKTLISAWHYCQQTFRTAVTELDNADAWYAVVAFDKDAPGPCAKTFEEIVTEQVQAVQKKCTLQYDNCVGGTNRAECVSDLRDAIGALQYDGNPTEIFEKEICHRSRDFQWLYSCVRGNEDGTTAWSMSECAAPDVLTYVQCATVVDAFRKGKACKAPPGGKWTPSTAKSYSCSEACASALGTALWECPTSFFKYLASNNLERDSKIALMMLIADDPLKTAVPRGKCSSVARSMIDRGVESIKTNAVCGPKYNACFEDIGCRELIKDAIAASFDPHAKRHFEGGLCSAPYLFQTLYACIEKEEEAKGVGDGSPWTGRGCLAPDELTSTECSNLMGSVSLECTGTGLLSVQDAPEYQCSESCSRMLVAVMSQCQTSLYTLAKEKWTDKDRAVFRSLVSRQSPYGPCRRQFAKVTATRLMQIQSSQQCGALYDSCAVNDWCGYNVRQGIGAIQTPEGQRHHETQLCAMSPDYQALYQCVSTSGFGAEKGWTTDMCQVTDPDSFWTGFVWVLLGMIIGGLVAYLVARHRFLRGDKGGSYKPVSETEVRSLIREYVDTSGLDAKVSKDEGLYSSDAPTTTRP